MYMCMIVCTNFTADGNLCENHINKTLQISNLHVQIHCN